MARIAVGGFQHETNTFAKRETGLAQFIEPDAWPVLVRGLEMLDAIARITLPAAGFVSEARSLGHRSAVARRSAAGLDFEPQDAAAVAVQLRCVRQLGRRFDIHVDPVDRAAAFALRHQRLEAQRLDLVHALQRALALGEKAERNRDLAPLVRHRVCIADAESPQALDDALGGRAIRNPLERHPITLPHDALARALPRFQSILAQ